MAGRVRAVADRPAGSAFQERAEVRPGSVAVHVAQFVCVVAAIVLLTVNLETWPRPWFDEGVFSAAAAGVAATGSYTPAGRHAALDPSVTVGPPVVLPVAIALRVFGVGIFQSRLPMVLLSLLTLLACYLLARALGGVWAALAGVALLIVGDGDVWTSLVPLGRQMLGEVPALGFLCFGCWVLLARTGDLGRSWRGGLLAGIAFGLGAISKPQMTLVLLPTLALAWLANRYYYRALPGVTMTLACAIGIGIPLAWLALQQGYTPPAEVGETRAYLKGLGLGFSTRTTRAALSALWHAGFAISGLPGLLYALYLARTRDRVGLIHGLLSFFLVVGLGWYVLLSVGWARYAALPLMLATLYLGRLLVDLGRGALPLPAWLPRRPLASVVLVGAVVLGGICGVGLARQVFGPQDTSLQSLAAYVRHEVPADALIESWAWELDMLVPQRFHHPDNGTMGYYISITWRGTSAYPNSYNPAIARPDYLIAGPFSNWTGIYDDYVDAHGLKLTQFGEYAVYRIR